MSALLTEALAENQKSAEKHITTEPDWPQPCSLTPYQDSKEKEKSAKAPK
jgi:hypothetical protein